MKKTVKSTAASKAAKSGPRKGSSKANISTKHTNGQMRMEDVSTLDDEGALNDLFIDLLKDIYWAEKHLVKKLPATEEAATSPELKKAINDHWKITKNQVAKVEQVFVSIGEEPTSKKCEAMKGLVEEVEEIIDETDEGTLTRDVGIIIAAQKVEHYEIAAYGGMVALAKVLGHTEAQKILEEIMQEEKQADEGLTAVAEDKRINERAAEE